ncbi:hypothetical protein SAMN04487996_104389 [Dyadobacter soli]|uniref:DUF2357 domain-containing protein n=1 Tax=Dyadobacter soli TaxID=659014 RepID=A0A1G7C3J0_9BACT|nr:DUF2357 domain-containing protein [Dyadobacter soli]SDE33867.1 hypothetical protein SAMN04487996_104389 [Dyadobacter soli]
MKGTELLIDAETSDGIVSVRIIAEERGEPTFFELDEWDAFEHGEARVQLLEGCFYEYEVLGAYALRESPVVVPSRINPAMGRLTPNVYVGTLTIEVLRPSDNACCGEIKVEIRSRKASYRSDYRLMLEGITERCTDLLFYYNAPVTHPFTPDYLTDPQTLYQRFAFVNAVLTNREFEIAFQKIIRNPITKWTGEEIEQDVRNLRKPDWKAIAQLATRGSRIVLPSHHNLKRRMASVPARISVSSKTDSVDTPENRFVKHALEVFAGFVAHIKSIAPVRSRFYDEATLLENHLNRMLSAQLFKEVEKPLRLALNGPGLVRKEGYKQVLRVWLMFDLAARLVWRGGDDVYQAGKKDVAVLYEYWLFFELLDVVKSVFAIEPAHISDLVKPTKNGLALQLKQGRHLPVSGIFDAGSRKLNVEFSFNRSFSGQNDYPQAGSWTTGMRPDFTLSIWPAGVSQAQAETEELIVHIHFDAKYKVESVAGVFGEDETMLTAGRIQPDHHRDDLLKMHSYKDAIRRTAGAYVLYPGATGQVYKRKGFHELIPGLGAFAIRPSKTDNGRDELKRFLTDVVAHFQNRASQREKIAFRNFDIYNSRSSEEMRELLPEPFGKNRDLIPDETFVLVGYYKNDLHLAWVRKHNLYNFRTGAKSGSLSLGVAEVNARYLLLHGPGQTVSSMLFKLNNRSPRLFSRRDLLEKGYPGPTRELYLVYTTDPDVEPEFAGMRWDVTQLPGYRANRASGLPFSVSLTDLMKVLVK